MTDEQPERMSTNFTRVEFDSTLDEVVDANMRLVQHTATYRTQRMHYQWFVGVSVAGGEAVAILSTRIGVPSYATLLVAASAAIVGGFALGMLYGRYHDWYVRRRYRRVLSEMYGGVQRIHCEYELRRDVLWARSVYNDTSFPWSRLTRVEDVHGCIELWFDPGLAVVRDRAFRSQEERRAFLGAVRQHLPDKGTL
jgi:hypothetical protein